MPMRSAFIATCVGTSETKKKKKVASFFLLSVFQDYCFLRSVLFDKFSVTLMEKLYVYLVGLTSCSYRDEMMMMLMIKYNS
jgi:hypothetical protein